LDSNYLSQKKQSRKFRAASYYLSGAYSINDSSLREEIGISWQTAIPPDPSTGSGADEVESLTPYFSAE
jgi:hypothetical protein